MTILNLCKYEAHVWACGGLKLGKNNAFVSDLWQSGKRVRAVETSIQVAFK